MARALSTWGCPLAWEGHAVLSTRSLPTMKPNGGAPSALPSDPWLQAFHSCRRGQCLCGMLPGSRGFRGWEPPAGKPCGSRGCPGRQTQRALTGTRPCGGPGFGLFTYAWMVSERSKGKTGERACVCVSVEPLPVNLVPISARTSLPGAEGKLSGV